MTKESMIKVLRYKAEHIKTRIKPEFFTEVADALEQQSEDAISRKWLKTAIHNFYHGLKHTPTEEDIQAYIDVAPSVEPKTRIGHWIPSHIPESILDECSECGFSCGAFTFNYCPNCGAKMVDPPDGFSVYGATAEDIDLTPTVLEAESMEEVEESKKEKHTCISCRFYRYDRRAWPCDDCLDYDRWKEVEE